MITIRRYQDSDFDELTYLWHLSKKDAFPYVAFLQSLTLENDRDFFRDRILPHHDVWVAESYGQLAGFMAIHDDIINQFFIGIYHQRQGVGLALLNKAKELSPNELRLYTFVKNHPARNFYEKHGFKAIKFGRSAPPESEPDVAYRWRPKEVDN